MTRDALEMKTQLIINPEYNWEEGIVDYMELRKVILDIEDPILVYTEQEGEIIINAVDITPGDVLFVEDGQFYEVIDNFTIEV
jgi:hypothetical protein